jgi:hypothetical protein
MMPRRACGTEVVRNGAAPAAAAWQLSGGSVPETGRSGPPLAALAEPPPTLLGGGKISAAVAFTTGSGFRLQPDKKGSPLQAGTHARNRKRRSAKRPGGRCDLVLLWILCASRLRYIPPEDRDLSAANVGAVARR